MPAQPLSPGDLELLPLATRQQVIGVLKRHLPSAVAALAPFAALVDEREIAPARGDEPAQGDTIAAAEASTKVAWCGLCDAPWQENCREHAVALDQLAV